jgi:hypothetical protein
MEDEDDTAENNNAVYYQAVWVIRVKVKYKNKKAKIKMKRFAGRSIRR